VAAGGPDGVAVSSFTVESGISRNLAMAMG
jgi:hypothetical protein